VGTLGVWEDGSQRGSVTRERGHQCGLPGWVRLLWRFPLCILFWTGCPSRSRRLWAQSLEMRRNYDIGCFIP
jgi:hypothetical protein